MNYQLESTELAYAKPSHELLWNFSKGLLEISGSTIDFLMYLSTNIDHDGKVNISFKDVCRELDIQPNTYNRIISETTQHQLLVKSGSNYYSNFHIQTNGSNGRREYVKLLKVFNSAEVRNLTLREKRLFYYFVTVTAIGYWQELRIENLYKNKLHTNARVGVNYFFSYDEVSNAIIKFIELGLIEVELKSHKLKTSKLSTSAVNDNPYERRTILTSKSYFIEQQFHAYFEHSTIQRKTRVNTITSQQRIIRVRIAPEHVDETLEVSASKTEFIQMSNNHCIAWDELDQKSIKYFIGIKNELFKRAGTLGLEIYRKCLNQYFENEAANIMYYDDQQKLVNYFMDFYVLNEIQSILVESIKEHKLYIKNSFSSPPSHSSEYILTLAAKNEEKQKLESLLNFFEKFSSINHKILLDAAMYKNNVNITDVFFNLHTWKSIFLTVQNEYYQHKVSMEEQLSEYSGLTEKIDDDDWKLYMFEVASHGLFVKKEKFAKEMKLKYERLTEMRIKKQVKKVEFYNWLEERG